MIENAAVQQERARLRQQYSEGLAAGYEANPNHLPQWWLNTPPGRMTAFQRGYFTGRELRLEEAENE